MDRTCEISWYRLSISKIRHPRRRPGQQLKQDYRNDVIFHQRHQPPFVTLRWRHHINLQTAMVLVFVTDYKIPILFIGTHAFVIVLIFEKIFEESFLSSFFEKILRQNRKDLVLFAFAIKLRIWENLEKFCPCLGPWPKTPGCWHSSSYWHNRSP